MANMTNCVKISDDFVEVIVISKSGEFMKSKEDLLNRAVYAIRKEL